MRFAGYIIYKEEIIREESGFFKNCWDIIKQLNHACCCYLCSFTYIVKCIFCCKVDCEKYNHYKKRKNSEINKTEEICIFYKVSGKCAWLTEILTETKILVFVLIIYIIELFNIGFRKVLIIDDKDENIKNKSFIINIISLVSILIFYIIDRYGGSLLNKLLNKIEEDFLEAPDCCVYGKEFAIIMAGILPTIIFESILTAIISSLIYYDKIKVNEYYFIPISIGCIEYLKLMCLNFLSFHFKTNNNDLEILSSSFVYSIYFLLWTAISFIIDLFNAKINKLILFQFILSLVILGLFVVFLVLQIYLYYYDKMESEKQKKKISDKLDLGLNLEYDDSLEDGKKNNFGNNKDIELSIKNVNDNE